MRPIKALGAKSGPDPLAATPPSVNEMLPLIPLKKHSLTTLAKERVRFVEEEDRVARLSFRENPR